MKKINFLVLIIFITGCTSCDKLSEVLDDNPDMPETIEVEKVDDNLEDVVFSSKAYTNKIIGLNTSIEKIYKIDLNINYIYSSPITFKEGFLIYLDRGSFSKKGLYRYFPKEGLLKKIDIKIGIRGWIKIDDDKIWIGSGENADQTSTVGIYSISKNKIEQYINIPYFISFPSNSGNVTKMHNKTYVPIKTDNSGGKSSFYCIEEEKKIDIDIFDKGGLKAPISGIIEKTGEICNAYKVESIEPLSLKHIFQMHINERLYYLYIHEIGDKYYLVAPATGNTGVMNKHTYKIDTIVNNFPKDENSTTGYDGTLFSYYKNGYIWTFGDDDTEICRLDPTTLEIKRIRY